MDNPTRKDIRLDGYDYSRSGAYFVTVCTNKKMHIFWENEDKYKPLSTNKQDVGTAIGRPQIANKIHLSEYGKYVKEALKNINKCYPMVFVDRFVIMPNHIHAIIRIDAPLEYETGGRPMAVPTISQVINQFKGYVSKKSGFHVWQGRFYDRIIRNGQEYRAYWQYIEDNPQNWENDEYFSENNSKER